MWKTYFAVMCGGAIGTGLRLWLSTWFAGRFGEAFPFGTIAVNVSGCFVIGFFAAMTAPEGPWMVSPLLRQVAIVGVLGGYTTFSAFSLQTLVLANHGDWLRAGANVLLSVVCCLVAVWLGHLAAACLGTR